MTGVGVAHEIIMQPPYQTVPPGSVTCNQNTILALLGARKLAG